MKGLGTSLTKLKARVLQAAAALAGSDKLAALGEASMPIRKQALQFLFCVVANNMAQGQPFAKSQIAAVNKLWEGDGD